MGLITYFGEVGYMIKRDQCEDLIIETASKNMHRRAFVRMVAYTMQLNHSIMPGRTNQLLNGTKKYLDSATDEELLWLALAIEGALNDPGLFKDYFTSKEYGMYSNSRAKIEDEEIYPVEFPNTLEIGANQWVTVININQLYDLYKKQLINYNKNTQRPLKRTERNGLVEYKIYLNNKSVKEIENLMQENRFIPNTLTFNVNLNNPNNVSVYKNGTFQLQSGSFDIVDGFHRYKALILCKMGDPSFNYNMILNIMRFDEEMASQFIAQEDNRNKISKRIINTMDSTNLINVVIQNLNSDGRSYIRGQIGRTNTDRINSVWLFEIIDSCYEIKDMRYAAQITKYLRNIFNALVEDDVLEYDYLTLAIIIKVSSMYQDESVAIPKIESTLRLKHHLDSDFSGTKKVTKSLLDAIGKLAKQGG